MKKFVIVCLLGLCVVCDVFAVDETHYSTYNWMKRTLSNMLCRFDVDTIQPNQREVIQVCDDKWIRFGSSCYLFGKDKMTFAEAKAFCEGFGAYFVTIENASENEFLKEYTAQLSAGGNYWIGLTDQVTENVWKWTGTDATARYYDWNIKEPRGSTGENCVVLWEAYGYSWGDISCTTKLRPICEK